MELFEKLRLVAVDPATGVDNLRRRQVVGAVVTGIINALTKSDDDDDTPSSNDYRQAANGANSAMTQALQKMSKSGGDEAVLAKRILANIDSHKAAMKLIGYGVVGFRLFLIVATGLWIHNHSRTYSRGYSRYYYGIIPWLMLAVYLKSVFPRTV